MIKDKTDFVAVLDRTILEVDGLAQSQPEYGVWQNLKKGLEIIKTSEQHPAGQSINIGLIAARELEPTDEGWLQDLIARLYLINQYWRAPPGPVAVMPKQSSRSALKISLILVVAVLLISLAAGIFSVATRSERGPWTANGLTPSRSDSAAKIEISLDPYQMSLNHNPDNDRYSVRLNRDGKIIPLASGLPLSTLRFGAEILGDDGQQIWFFVEQIGAWNYLDQRLIEPGDLRSLNRDLPEYSSNDSSGDPLISEQVQKFRSPKSDIFSGERRLYEFRNRLLITTPDFKQTYAVNPQTLKATLLHR